MEGNLSLGLENTFVRVLPCSEILWFLNTLQVTLPHTASALYEETKQFPSLFIYHKTYVFDYTFFSLIQIILPIPTVRSIGLNSPFLKSSLFKYSLFLVYNFIAINLNISCGFHHILLQVTAPDLPHFFH